MFLNSYKKLDSEVRVNEVVENDQSDSQQQVNNSSSDNSRYVDL
jgi:hypothetical protein